MKHGSRNRDQTSRSNRTALLAGTPDFIEHMDSNYSKTIVCWFTYVTYSSRTASIICSYWLGSGLLDQSQKMTTAAMQMADECAPTSVVTSVDAPPVLDPAEHVLDPVPLTIEFAVIFNRVCGSTSTGCRPQSSIRRGRGEISWHRNPCRRVTAWRVAAHRASTPRLCNRSFGLRWAA